MSTAAGVDHVTESIGWTLVHATWEISLIYAAYLMIRITLRQSSVRVRYLLGCFTLVGILLSLAVTFSVEVLQEQRPTATSASLGQGETGSRASKLPRENAKPASELIRDQFGRLRYPRLSAADWFDHIATAVEPHLPALVFVWCTVAGILLLRNGLGFWGIKQLVASGRPLLGHQTMRFGSIATRMGIDRPVSFLSSPRIATPLTVGFLRPIVFLPCSIAACCTVEEIELAIFHELAHVRRYDYLVNLVQVIVETVLFHPCVLLISRDIRRDRERLCDSIAVAAAPDAKSYALLLLKLVDLRLPHNLSLGLGGGRLFWRIESISSLGRHRPVNLWSFSFSLVLCLVCSLAAGTSIVERADAWRDRQYLIRTHESDFVSQLVRLPRASAEFRPALIAGLTAARQRASIRDQRLTKFVEVASKGFDFGLVWREFLASYDGSKYPTASKEYPADWAFGDPGTQRMLARMIWSWAKAQPPGLVRDDAVKVGLAVASMRRELSGLSALSTIVLDREFDAMSGLSPHAIRRMRQYISVSQDAAVDSVLAMRECRLLLDRTGGPDGGIEHALEKAFMCDRRMPEVAYVAGLLTELAKSTAAKKAGAEWLRLNRSDDRIVNLRVAAKTAPRPYESVTALVAGGSSEP